MTRSQLSACFGVVGRAGMPMDAGKLHPLDAAVHSTLDAHRGVYLLTRRQDWVLTGYAAACCRKHGVWERSRMRVCPACSAATCSGHVAHSI